MGKRQNKPEDKIPTSRPVLYSGSAGWTIPREFSPLFPSGGTHLERYSRVLNCAEINSSFYRPHKPQTWERWRESVPDNFVFSVKAPKAITHEAKLDCLRGVLSTFLDQLAALGNKLGPILFQLPPSLQFTEALAQRFMSMLRELHSGEIVWEPRHPTWFQPGAGDLLKRFEVARVAADPACVPEGSRPGGWTGLHYYRLHGSPQRYYSAYTTEFLKNIVTEASREATPKVWCIFDNTASGAATGNALELAGIWPEPRRF